MVDLFSFGKFDNRNIKFLTISFSSLISIPHITQTITKNITNNTKGLLMLSSGNFFSFYMTFIWKRCYENNDSYCSY